MEIITNNRPRPILSAWDLTEKEKAEFAYLDLENGEGSFFRYRGWVYDLGEFQLVTNTMLLHWPDFERWNGYHSDSFFSGILVRYCEGYESVVVATYIN